MKTLTNKQLRRKAINYQNNSGKKISLIEAQRKVLEILNAEDK